MRVIELLIVAFLFVGCSLKQDEKIVYKEVLIPVKCQVRMPKKPMNDKSFEAHKALMIYFLECESLLKECVGVKSE